MVELIICGYFLVAVAVYFFFIWIFKEDTITDEILSVMLIGSLLWVISVPTLVSMLLGVCIIKLIKMLKYKGKHMKEE